MQQKKSDDFEDLRTPYDVSKQLFKNAKELIPGGVNSPVRAFKNVGGEPLFIAGGEGAIIQDMDGNQFVDFVGSWGAMLLGHANPQVVTAIKTAAECGTSFGAPIDKETCLADFITSRHKHIDMVRLVNSGTEATMSAIRLARGFTGRDRIIKCDGCYHGHGDSLLVAAGSGLATHGTPDSAGVPKALAELTSVVAYNDLEAMRKVFEDSCSGEGEKNGDENSSDIACIIIEPIAGNMGCVLPQEGYLQGLRDLCDEYGALLIIDEVMTGFRVGFGSAQTKYDVRPDLACFGKVIGGGLPLAAFGGRKEIMEHLSPLGDVYQAGTLAGNPLAVSAGIATLEQITQKTYDDLEAKSLYLTSEMDKILTEANIPHTINRVGAMFSIFFRETAPQNYEDVRGSDLEKFRKFFWAMLKGGVYLPPSPYECWFVSTTHDDEVIAHTLKAMKEAVKCL